MSKLNQKMWVAFALFVLSFFGFAYVQSGAVAATNTRPEALEKQYTEATVVSATLSGKVLSRTVLVGIPDVKIVVFMYKGDAGWVKLGLVRTDANGSYSVGLKKTGFYFVDAEKAGFTFLPNRHYFTISKSGNVVKNFVSTR